MKRLMAVLLGLTICVPASAQVFSINPAAGTGQTGVDDVALYGGFGLNASDSPAYNVYRKYGERDPALEGTKGSNVAGNPSAMAWNEMYHNGDTGIIDPGMWIGSSPATSSPADQLLYFKPAIDEEGGGVDDNNRRDWDLRFGFLEDAATFVNNNEPNSNEWDLWSGSWDTDGISAQLNIGTNELGDETDWYSRRSGFRINAETNEYGDERGRTINDWDSITFAGSDLDIEPFDGNNTYSGVGYDDAIEISWNLEEIADDEVQFTIKVGNVVQVGTFDPTAVPNDDEEEFSGGSFDWQNSTPVFFVAPTGGGEASGEMGIFIPGDFNADGAVDDADLAIVTDNQGGVETTYSRGDLNQDGLTDEADLTAFMALSDPGAQIDSIKDFEARLAFVHDTLNTWIGDSNLDGVFDSSDFVEVFQEGQYEDSVAMNSVWATGDWNGDMEFDSGDFVVAFQDGGFENGPRPAVAAVPEPSSLVLTIMLLCGLAPLRRRS